MHLENSKNAKQLHDVVIQLLQWLSSPQQDTLRQVLTVWFSRVLFPTQLGDNEKLTFQDLPPDSLVNIYLLQIQTNVIQNLGVLV